MQLLGLLEESTLLSNVKAERWMRFGIFTMYKEVYNLAHSSQRIQVYIAYYMKHPLYWQSVPYSRDHI